MSGELIFSMSYGENLILKNRSFHIRERRSLSEFRAKLHLQRRDFCPGSLFNKRLPGPHHEPGVILGI